MASRLKMFVMLLCSPPHTPIYSYMLSQGKSSDLMKMRDKISRLPYFKHGNNAVHSVVTIIRSVVGMECVMGQSEWEEMNDRKLNNQFLFAEKFFLNLQSSPIFLLQISRAGLCTMHSSLLAIYHVRRRVRITHPFWYIYEGDYVGSIKQ